jgi:hypothetical protein
MFKEFLQLSKMQITQFRDGENMDQLFVQTSYTNGQWVVDKMFNTTTH